MSKFLVNKNSFNVSIDDARYFVARGTCLEVADEVAALRDVGDAVRRGWLEVSDVKVDLNVELPSVKAEVSAKDQGSTEFPGAKPLPAAAVAETEVAVVAAVAEAAPTEPVVEAPVEETPVVTPAKASKSKAAAV